MVFSTGHDLSDNLKFNDGLGITYTAIAGSWTFILLIGITFLVYHRNLPCLRIRNLPLAISAVAALHVYWVLCFVAFGLNGHFPCTAEFWLMSIYLPLGIALFHASNSQLLYIAKTQQRFIRQDAGVKNLEKVNSYENFWMQSLERLKSQKAMKVTMHYIALGMIAQFIISILVFLLSRRFHQNFGIMGEDISYMDTPHSRAICRQGFEWLPSIFWQFFWAWVYAPYMLWQVRKIKDAHGWRTQTICCCIAGLPASPMWLLALYLPEMANVSKYVIPPLWFTPSILLIEVFMIFAPVVQVIKHEKLKRETLEVNAEWERYSEGSSVHTSSTRVDTSLGYSSKTAWGSSENIRRARSHLYTLAALDKALETNATPLLLFAALKDFSGENVSFLNAVREWKQGWATTRPSYLRDQTADLFQGPHLRRLQYQKAVEIYSSFASLKYSEYPINISSSHLKELEALFETVAVLVNCDRVQVNAVTPFDDLDGARPSDIEMSLGRDGMSTASTMLENGSTEHLTLTSNQRRASVVDNYRTKQLQHKFADDIPVPAEFGPKSFDDAVTSIKYTVLTNTWPKFVNAGYNASQEQESTFGKLSENVKRCRTNVARLLSIE